MLLYFKKKKGRERFWLNIKMLLRDYVVDKGLCFVNFFLYKFIFI